MRNPPVFDQILIDHYEQLEKVVPQEWMPLPVVLPSSAAQEIERQQKRLVHAEAYAKYLNREHGPGKGDAYYHETVKDVEKQIAKLVKKKQHRQGFREYGSGHYGSVYPTAKPGIVCKITTDATEAQFIANAISLNKWPPGIVKYYAVFQFSGKRHRRRPVYIVWRDEAQPPVLTNDDSHAGVIYQNALHSVKYIASRIRTMITGMIGRVDATRLSSVWEKIARAKDMEEREFYFFLPEQSLDMDKPNMLYNWLFRFKGLKIPMENKLATLFWLFKNGCDNLDMSHGFSPGHALWWYFENDMLLADVHSNNVMKAQDGSWEISDPGHMIELSNRYLHVKIPTL